MLCLCERGERERRREKEACTEAARRLPSATLEARYRLSVFPSNLAPRRDTKLVIQSCSAQATTGTKRVTLPTTVAQHRVEFARAVSTFLFASPCVPWDQGRR